MNAIKEYSFVEKALNELSIQYKDVPDANTNEGYEACKVGAKEVGKYRIALEEKRVKIKGPALKKCKAIDEEAKRIQLVIASLENPLKLAYKGVDEKNKQAEEKRVSGILAIIDGMTVFIDLAKTGTIETISEWIEQVEDIDCSDKDMFAEFSKDAALERNRVLESLQIELRRTIQQEADEKKRKEQELELEELKAKEEKAALVKTIDNKIQNYRNITTDYFGKPSTEINDKIIQLENFFAKQETWGDRCNEVQGAVDLVIAQLKQLLISAKMIEEAEADKENARQVVEPEEESKPEEMVVHKETVGELITKNFLPDETVDDLPIEQTPEEPAVEEVKPDIDAVKGFLEWAVCIEDVLNDFGHLLLSDDPRLNAEALDNIRDRFVSYVTD